MGQKTAILGTVLSSACLFLPLQAFAADGLIFEPYLGFEFGQIKQAGVTTIDFQAAAIGAKLGYMYSGIGAGLEYSMGFGKGVQVNLSGDYKPTDLAAFLEYSFDFGLNCYGSYFFSSKAKIQSRDNASNFTGRGAKAGISWSGFSFFSIGIEEIYRSYSKYSSTTLNNPLKALSTSVVLGFPL